MRRSATTTNGSATRSPGSVRVAIYARQSVTRGDDGGFGSIEAQREAVEAFVKSQAGEGWAALPDRFDDGGFSGATTDRPALRRLLERVAAGGIDVVACYKLDRLSRSLVDFARLTALFEEQGVSFVSITQSFNSATPMGKLTLNILMSFAEFEREQIAERTRDKMLATRRRGHWTGGRPMLGYDVVDGALVPNAGEAERVRAIFRLYGELGSLTAVLTELRRRGWTNKRWTTKHERCSGGGEFTSASLRRLLSSPLVVGRIRAGDEIVDGRHEAIVDEQTWIRTQDDLRRAAASGERPSREPKDWDNLLASLIECGRCGRSMCAVYTARGAKRYRAYVCATIQKRGAAACPGARAPGPALEDIVVSKLRALGRDPALRRRAAAELKRGGTAEGGAEADVPDFLRALVDFEPVWKALFPAERGRIVRLLVERVVYDPDVKTVRVDFRPAGLRAFLRDVGAGGGEDEAGGEEPAAGVGET